MRASTVEDAQRDDDTLTIAALISAYEKGVEELRLAVAGMTVEQLRSRPVAGKWSTLEVVRHIADCEQFFADRMKRTVAMDLSRRRSRIDERTSLNEMHQEGKRPLNPVKFSAGLTPDESGQHSEGHERLPNVCHPVEAVAITFAECLGGGLLGGTARQEAVNRSKRRRRRSHL